MKVYNNLDAKEFWVSYNGMSLPFKLFSIEHIVKELEEREEYFGPIIKMENATKKKIQDYYKEKHSQHSRFFAYIKFFNYESKRYGLIGGKTNYTSPDLSFDYLDKEKSDKRYARIFLDRLNNTKWGETIVIVNHKLSTSENIDDDEAKFVECYLQRRFNLFNS